MLTALSVARECDFVSGGEKIILVQAFPQQTDIHGNITEAAHIEYINTEPQQSGPNLSITNKGKNGQELFKMKVSYYGMI